MSNIPKQWNHLHQQRIEYNGQRYSVADLADAAKDLPVKKVKLDTLNVSYEAPCENSLRSFVTHLRMVEDADLSFPCILSPEGTFLDGRHRLAKALWKGDKEIGVVKFESMPNVGTPIEE